MRTPLAILLFAGLAIAPSPARGVGDTPPDPTPLLAGVPTWEELAPPTRAWAATAHDTRRDRLLVIGGMSESEGTPTSSVWAFSLGFERWDRVRPTGTEPAPRRGAAAVYDSVRDRVVLYGGDLDAGAYSTWSVRPEDDLWVLELAGTPWWRRIPRAGAWPSKRAFAGFAMDGGRSSAWLYGGGVVERVDSAPDTATLWRLDLDALTWTRHDAVGPWPLSRESPGMVWAPERAAFIVHGGRAWQSRTPLADTWVLTPGVIAAWTPVPATSAPDPASDFAFVRRRVNGDLLRIAVATPGAWAYSTLSPVTLEWNSWPEPLDAPPPRSGAWAADLGAAGVAYGGGLSDRVTHADTWRIPARAYESSRPMAAAPEFDEDHPRFFALDPARGTHVHLEGRSRLWRYDVVQRAWQRGPYLSNAPRSWGSRAALDATRDRLLLLGGAPPSNYWPPPPPNREVRALELADPHEWTIALPSDVGHPALMEPTVVVDPSRDRWLVIATEASGSSSSWALELSPAMRWSRVPVRGSAPGLRHGGEATWDEMHGQIVLVEGRDEGNVVGWTTTLADTLEWTPRAALGDPAARRRYALTYDPAQQRALVHGGTEWLGPWNPAEFWELSLAGAPAWHVGSGAGDAPPRGAAAFAEWPGDPFARLELANNRVFRVSWTLPSPTSARGESLLVAPAGSRVVWSGAAGAGLVASVECRDTAAPSAWRRVGSTISTDDGYWRFTEGSPSSEPLAYRLVFERETGPVATGEIRLGRAPSFGALSVACASANPGPSIERVQLTLPARAAVALSLVDVTGRRVWTNPPTTLEAGVHVLGVTTPERPRPGLYWLVAEAGGRRASTRVAIVR